MASERLHRTLRIGRRVIGDDQPSYVIAEVGINYNGRLDLALAMVDEAARAGADAVKVQIVDADKSYARESESYKIFKAVELPLTDWDKVAVRARERGIDIFASFGQPGDVALVERFGFPAVKVSSSNVTNFPLLKAAAAAGRPVVLSTGLSYFQEVKEAVDYLTGLGCRDVAVLQCTSLYPAPFETLNLRTLPVLKETFGCPVGFSDHSTGVTAAVAAVALGARIIEKHFTLDPGMEGPDHYFSSSPAELAALVRAVRETEAALGSAVKDPVPAEIPVREKLQRSLVAARDIASGEVLTAENVAVKRSPSRGLAPKMYDAVLGRKARSAIRKDAPIIEDALL